MSRRIAYYNASFTAIPTNTVAPVISGLLTFGSTLTTTNGTWAGIGTIGYTYQWRRNGVDIGGATASTYILTVSDLYTNIDCVVTATNEFGVGSQASNTVIPYDFTASNSRLYFAKNVATISSWADQSPNGYDVTQANAINQPSIGTDTVDFDGINDYMYRSIANVYSGDSSGYIFFSGIFNNSINNFIINSSDVSTNNFFFSLFIATTGVLRLTVRYNGFANTDTLVGDTIISNGQYYYGWVRSNGSIITASINGVTQTISASNGGNNGRWFASVPNRDNLSLGALVRLVNSYGSARINKVAYLPDGLTANQIANLEAFFSNPNNY